ncbi:MAG: uridine monophosphate kinase, partial [Lentisphaerae bacterium]
LECIRALREVGAQIGIVVGGGNIVRGANSVNFSRAQADAMGMLGTVINAIALEDVLNAGNVPARAYSAIEINRLLPPFRRQDVIEQLEEGVVTIFGAGTGNPFLTTDTTAALRALEIDAQLLIKATKVDGVYSADPVTHPDAKRFEKISAAECLQMGLKIMDAAAFSLCQAHRLPIVVCSFKSPQNLVNILNGDFSAGTLVSF